MAACAVYTAAAAAASAWCFAATQRRRQALQLHPLCMVTELMAAHASQQSLLALMVKVCKEQPAALQRRRQQPSHGVACSQQRLPQHLFSTVAQQAGFVVCADRAHGRHMRTWQMLLLFQRSETSQQQEHKQLQQLQQQGHWGQVQHKHA